MSEKRILKDVLETYQYLPCLWDPSDKYYANREARSQAYEILLEKYKAIDNEANIDMLKKRLENMRCSYRREYKKVMASRLSGCDPHEEYKPSLWYYNNLLFLEEKKGDRDVSVIVPKRSFSSGDEAGNDNDSNDDYNIANTSNQLIYSPPKPKRKKTDNSSVFITQSDDDGFQGRDTLETLDDNNSEVEAFGRTIGLQLKGLSDIQRHIAEKLMSDIIYFGRLNQLNLRTTVNLNEDFM